MSKRALNSVAYELLVQILVSERIAREVSQDELARGVGVSRQSISAYENLTRAMSIDTALDISRYLGVDWITLNRRWLSAISKRS